MNYEIKEIHRPVQEMYTVTGWSDLFCKKTIATHVYNLVTIDSGIALLSFWVQLKHLCNQQQSAIAVCGVWWSVDSERTIVVRLIDFVDISILDWMREGTFTSQNWPLRWVLDTCHLVINHGRHPTFYISAVVAQYSYLPLKYVPV